MCATGNCAAEMWFLRRMLKMYWTSCVKNQEVFDKPGI